MFSTWTRRAILALPLLLAACTGGAPVEPPPEAPPADTIVVGEFGSMTGSEATFGQSTHQGIILALEEFNKAGGLNGKQVEVKTYDDQGKTQEAGTAVTRLITDNKVVAVLGEVSSGLSMAGGAVAQQYGVPMISPSSTNVQVTQIGDMIHRVCFVDSFQGYVSAKFARETLGLNSVAILFDQTSPYSSGLKDDFAREFVALGGTIAGEPQAYSLGDPDFSAQLTSIREAAPQAVFIPGYYTDVGNIALQARKLGLTVPLLGGDGWDSSQLATIAGDAIEGAYYSNHYSHEENRPEVQAFVAAYTARWGETPDGLAALGYDAARILFDSMKRAPSLGGNDLAAAIAQTKDFPGVTGLITIDPERNAQKPAVIVQMRQGKPGYVTTIYPKGVTPPAAPAAPAEGSAAPAEGSAAPAEGSATPAPAQTGK